MKKMQSSMAAFLAIAVASIDRGRTMVYRPPNPAAAQPTTKARPVKSRLSLKKIVRVCPGLRHAWFDSYVGPVRKELAQP